MSWLSMTLLGTAVAAATILVIRIAWQSLPRFVRNQADRVEADFASLFIYMPVLKMLALSAAVAVTMALTLWLAGVIWPLAVAIGAVSLLLPRIVVAFLRRRRTGRIAGQLPDALGMWAGLLRTGQGLSQALAQVAEHQRRPIGDELRLVVRQCRMGVNIESAFEEFRCRTPVADLTMLATLLRAARELGGNMAESLQRLADVMRARLAMEARIRALTAQGRLQGLIVGLLPLLLGLVLMAMEPQAMNKLFTTPQGWAALVVIAALETTGFVLIRRIVSINV